MFFPVHEFDRFLVEVSTTCFSSFQSTAVERTCLYRCLPPRTSGTGPGSHQIKGKGVGGRRLLREVVEGEVVEGEVVKVALVLLTNGVKCMKRYSFFKIIQ